MKKKLWSEQKYTRIVKEIGEGNYQIFEPQDPFVSYLYQDFPGQFPHRFMGVCLATSATIATSTVDFVCEDIKIARGSQVIDWRTFRYCEHDGYPHLNADDNIIFPDHKGNIWKISKNDAPDHYINIATWAGLNYIAEAYHLPCEKQGPYSKYVENGATVPIRIECQEKSDNE